jgi:hypothetical protein
VADAAYELLSIGIPEAYVDRLVEQEVKTVEDVMLLTE